MKRRGSLTGALLATIAAGAALTAPAARAADIWVDANYTGATSDGTSARPFKKISDTWSAVNPGDTVRVRPGVYREGVWIKSGTSDSARVTYRSEVKWGAQIITPASNGNGGCFQYWGGNVIDNVSDPSAWTMMDSPTHTIAPGGWVTIDGFELRSEVTDSTGAGTWLQWVHHVTIRNCWAHDNAAHGIGASLCDYMVFENNVVNDNALGNRLGTGNVFSSGINLWKVRPWDTATGFHNKIRNNVVFSNHNDLGNPARSDGNGIIVDTTGFDKGTLVENNLVVNNGAAGIMLDGTANCTVRYNTLYQNCWDKDYPEIYAQKVTWETNNAPNQENTICSNTEIYGNVIVARPNRLAVKSNSDNSNSSVHHNLRWFSGQSSPSGVPAFYGNDGNLNDTAGTGDVTGQDPQFVNPTTDRSSSDFHLQHYSAAINRYTVNTSDSKDLDGQTRSGSNSFVDLGAYEYKSFVGQPGFEELSSLTNPYGSSGTGGSFGIDISNGRQHTGSRSAFISVSAGAGNRWNEIRQTLSGLSPNTTYSVTVWLWNSTGAIGPNTYLGTRIVGGADIGATAISPATGSYGKYTWTFNTGSLTSLILYLGYNAPANQSAVLRIDDISVNVKTPLP